MVLHTLSLWMQYIAFAPWLTVETSLGMVGHLDTSYQLVLLSSLCIGRFSAFYRARMASEQHGSNPEKGSSPLSTASSSSTLMSSPPPPPPPPPPPFCHVLSVQGRRPCIKDGNLVPMTETSSMLTSVTTSTEQEFRRDLATLDADIARLHIQFKVAQQMT